MMVLNDNHGFNHAVLDLWMMAEVLRFSEARVNGRSNYDSLKVFAERLII